MKTLIRSAWFSLALAASVISARALQAVDCTCLANLPALQVTNCSGVVPALCSLGTNCFSTNVLAGTCNQSPPAGTILTPGTYSISLNVLDNQSNLVQCIVGFTVTAPAPVFTVTCPTNKTVECGSLWTFDQPIWSSTCCDTNIMVWDMGSTTNGTCPKIITQVWHADDACGNYGDCTQIVTVVDTTMPTSQCSGINLVPNGNFEFYTNCPTAVSQFNYAYPWFLPTDATSDYFNSCGGPGSPVSTPTNAVGVCVPLSGQGYGGAFVYGTLGNPTNYYREYLEVPLAVPLAPGQQYLVSFHVTRGAQYAYAIAEIGARLSPIPLTSYGTPMNPSTGVLNFPPQIVNPSANIITSTTNWTLIQGTYTALGGESYLVLGNFLPDPLTTGAPASGFGGNIAYYYFDDVSIVAICNPLTNKTVQCGSAWVFDAPVPYDSCSGNNVSVTTTTTTNGTCPQAVTRTWKLTDQCGNTNWFSQTVTIVDTNPPMVLCAPGANLVPNPQFENHTACPSFFSQLGLAAPWYSPSVATPDYLNTCANWPQVSVPTNFFGSQTPFSGQGYAGAFAYSKINSNNLAASYREYLQVPLLSSLIGGMTYQVSFHVSLADFSDQAIADLGAHFSTGPVFLNSQGVMNVVPQYVNPPTNILSSTNTWMLVQGTFVAAGGEDHLTLGNFFTDAGTTAVANPSWYPFFTNQAYYLYDDVSVRALCPAQSTNKTILCGAPLVFDTPVAFDACSGTNINVAVASTVTNGICPHVVTRTWSLTDQCGNSNSWSQSVTMIDTNPPVIFCSPTNLVLNPQFDLFNSCPTGLSMINLASPWYQPTFATPDYFNTCAHSNTFVSVPANFMGTQTPFSGNGYAGACIYSRNFGNDTNACYREYLQAPLLSPLVAGRTYSVSFRVNLTDAAGWAISEIGAYLSPTPVTNFSYMGVLPVIPQVENPSSNPLTSTNTWMLVQGLYTAVGGEQYLTLGNFHTDTATTAVPATGPETGLSYYYFEDVHVESVCTGFVAEKLIPCGGSAAFDNVSAYDACSGTNITTTINTVTNSVCPFSATHIWTFTDSCGNSSSLSQMIIVTNNSPIVVNCGCLQDSILPLLTTNACSGVIPNLSLLTNSPCVSGGNTNCGPIQITQYPPPGTIVGPGVTNITVSFSRCGGPTASCQLPYYVNAPAPYIVCPVNQYLLTCTGGAIAYFTPIAYYNVGPVVCSPPSGSVFPLGATTVTCTATNACGVASSCTFTVNVRPWYTRWGCIIISVAIDLPGTGFGGSVISARPALPGGGTGVDLGPFGASGQDGLRLAFGPSDKLTFTTLLDFSESNGASFNLSLPDINGGPSTPLLNFTRSCAPRCGWNIKASSQFVNDTNATYRSIAIGADGDLLSSFLHTAASLDTNVLVSLAPMNGATSALVTVTLDCRTREITLALPGCTWTRDAARKGWDGDIYGPIWRASETNYAARFILTPLTAFTLPVAASLDILGSNLTQLDFDNPSLTAFGRKFTSDNLSVMRGYDEGMVHGLEVAAVAAGGGVTMDLGHSASFRVRLDHFETGDIPTEEQFYSLRAWPPGPLTNRPAPPPILFRLTHGTTGVDCAADFTTFGTSNVTLQVWNGTTLVAEKTHVAAAIANPLATLSTFPAIVGSPGAGVLSLSHTNPFTVYTGLDCPGGCTGTELRIFPELSSMQPAPATYTQLQCQFSEGTDVLLTDFQRTLACPPGPLSVTRTTSGFTLDWLGDTFRLQGAESLPGPWYDLGVTAPVTLPANSNLRLFRLICD